VPPAAPVPEAEREAALPLLGRRRPRRRFVLRARGVTPAARLLGVALATTAEVSADAALAPFRSPARRAARRDARRERTWLRLVAALGALKGAFAKAGQFASMRHDVVPGAAARALARLQDRVPPLPVAAVREVIAEELGAPPERLFAAFDPEPLGAASVAQVHRARLPDGREVAVKVQYPWLARSLEGDLRMVRRLLGIAARRGGPVGVDRERLWEEFERGLREELDFEKEARAAREIAANLADDPQIVVPGILASHSGRRVLTMDYRPALPVRDPEALRARGIDPEALVPVIGRAYAKQLFVDGLFHADPHPGNLLVLDEPGAAERPRILFVDFGLSRRLDPELRDEMRRAILALLKRDLAAFVAGMRRTGMIASGAEDAVRASVERMFARMAKEGSALALGGTQVLALKDEAVRLLRETPGVQLPQDLLLFAKTLSYVFALGEAVAPRVDLLRVCLPYLLGFLGGGGPEPARTPGAPGAGPGGG